MLEDFCIPTIRLGYGHGSPGEQACWMSALSVLVGEKWTDHLKCVDVPINELCITINDAFGTGAAADEARSRVILPRLFDPIGTAGDPAATERRNIIMFNANIRTWIPDMLRFHGAADSVALAARFSALPPIMDQATFEKYRDELRASWASLASWASWASLASWASWASLASWASGASWASWASLASGASGASWASGASGASGASLAATVESYIVEKVLPVLDEMIAAGPHAPRENVAPKVEPKEFLSLCGVTS